MFFLYLLLLLGLPRSASTGRESLRTCQQWLKPRALQHKLPATHWSPPSPQEGAWVALGQKLFFDKRLAVDQNMACATCHDPAHSWSDPYPQGQGRQVLPRRTPSLLDAYAHDWFFWDGRRDSLEGAVITPLENPHEHHFTRNELASLLAMRYSQEIKALEPHLEWPALIPQGTPGRPAPQAIVLDDGLGAYALASLGNLAAMNRVFKQAQDVGMTPADYMKRELLPEKPPQAWVDSWQELGPTRQEHANSLLWVSAKALAAFVRTLRSEESPWDRFVQRWEALPAGEPFERALDAQDGFGREEWQGWVLFETTAGCAHCHTGPYFTDQQFHNIGLPQRPHVPLDPGRAVGVQEALNYEFRCRANPASTSCQELDWVDTQSPMLLGAFKTPSLRHVGARTHYMHDGRFKTLEEVIAHYDGRDAGWEDTFGHREETLRRLDLTAQQQKQLVLFLTSLSGTRQPVLAKRRTQIF